MANTENNIGALGTTRSLTPQSNWDSMFRNFQTGETPSSKAERRNSIFAGSTLLTNPQQDEINKDWMAGRLPGLEPDEEGAAKTFNLENMAAGGMNHAQQWSKPNTPFTLPPSTAPSTTQPRGAGLPARGGTTGYQAPGLSRDGWYTTGREELDAIRKEFKPKKNVASFGWNSAFQV